MISTRFRTATKRNGLIRDRYQSALDCTQFARPGARQLGLDL